MSDTENFDALRQQVTCAECGRTYQCTPRDDYYNSTTATDGVCTRCLIGNLPLVTMSTEQKS